MIVFSEDKSFALNNNNVLYYATSRPSASGVCELTAYLGAGESVQLAKGSKERLRAIIKDIAVSDSNGIEAYNINVSGVNSDMSEEALKQDTKYVLPVNGGELVVIPTAEAKYPGVYVDFRPQGQDYEYPVALVESTYEESSDYAKGDCVNIHLWENPETDDTTYNSHVKLSAYDSEKAVC